MRRGVIGWTSIAMVRQRATTFEGDDPMHWSMANRSLPANLCLTQFRNQA